MSSQKEQDKKKKKRQSILEAELFRIMEKSLKAAMDKALDDIRGRYGLDTIKRGSTLQSSQNVGKKYRAQLAEKNDDKKR